MPKKSSIVALCCGAAALQWEHSRPETHDSVHTRLPRAKQINHEIKYHGMVLASRMCLEGEPPDPDARVPVSRGNRCVVPRCMLEQPVGSKY